MVCSQSRLSSGHDPALSIFCQFTDGGIVHHISKPVIHVCGVISNGRPWAVGVRASRAVLAHSGVNVVGAVDDDILAITIHAQQLTLHQFPATDEKITTTLGVEDVAGVEHVPKRISRAAERSNRQSAAM
jgi:hypothetical protein